VSSLLRRWLHRDKVSAIHKRDLETVLTDLGIIEKISSGEFLCASCGKSIALDSIQCLFMENNVVKACCSNVNCYQYVVNHKLSEPRG
jgi:hypothetical protein